jgi:hypothetical protein
MVDFHPRRLCSTPATTFSRMKIADLAGRAAPALRPPGSRICSPHKIQRADARCNGQYDTLVAQPIIHRCIDVIDSGIEPLVEYGFRLRRGDVTVGGRRAVRGAPSASAESQRSQALGEPSIRQ